MQRIAFLSPVFPLPLDRGQNVRIFNLLRACARDFDVTLITPPAPTAQAKACVETLCRSVIYVDEANTPSLGSALRHLLTLRIFPTRNTLRIVHSYNEALSSVDLSQFELIWAEKPLLARLCLEHAERTIVDLDDLEYIKRVRQIRLQSPSPRMLSSALRIVRAWLEEVPGSRNYLVCILCSDEDRTRLTRWGLKNVVTIRNGVDVPECMPRRFAPDRSVPVRLVFVGNMGYGPNADAVEFFVHQVLPLCTGPFPTVTFDVIGPGVTEGLSSTLGTRVRFRGFVEDLPGALAEYDVFVAPLRFGSGTKLKILEAMANRLPVVTTSIGAEGLGLTHDANALIANSAQQIADSIIALWTDPARAERIADRALADVRERFQWAKIREHFADWLQELANQVMARSQAIGGPRPRSPAASEPLKNI